MQRERDGCSNKGTSTSIMSDAPTSLSSVDVPWDGGFVSPLQH